MIRFATANDHPKLKALWAEAFGDPRPVIDLYFSARHMNKNMLVDVRNNTIAGMLSMLPVTLCTGTGNMYPARYLYAVATDVQYRGQGISTALLAAAHAHIKNAGESACVLVPGSRPLFDFYAKRGYKTAFYLDSISVGASDLPPVPALGKLTACSTAEYTSVRNLAFHTSRLYAHWEEAAVSYTLQTFAPTGGFAALSWEGGHGCASWETAAHGILVQELALLKGDVYDALAILHRSLNAAQYTVRLAQGTIPDAIPKPFGMIHWLIPEPTLAGDPPYLSLAMD